MSHEIELDALRAENADLESDRNRVLIALREERDFVTKLQGNLLDIRAENARLRAALEDARARALNEALAIAVGCEDYGGGYRYEPRLLDAFHHGMQTVARCIEARMENVNDTQTSVALAIGQAAIDRARAAIDAARKGECAHTNQKPICHRLIDGIGRVVFQCQDCLAELIYEEPEDHGATLGSALREEPRT